MIDIHSHIIWGVDDGASCLEESLDMLRVAADAGTTDIVATPHANSSYPFDPELLSARYQELAIHHPGLPRIHRGCDFHLSAGNIHDALQNPTKYTVNNGRYLMVELPEMFHPPAIGQALRQLSATDIVPVVTHPERNPVLQKTPAILEQWVNDGCLAQVTARALTGHFGGSAKSTAWRFLRAGQIHFVASDAHNTSHRPPRLDEVQKILSTELGEFAAKCLTLGNPQYVIEDREPDFDTISQKKPSKWLQLLGFRG